VPEAIFMHNSKHVTGGWEFGVELITAKHGQLACYRLDVCVSDY